MNSSNRLICKSWVPTWLFYLTMFLFLLPIASVLGIYMGGGAPVAASYYGVKPIDIKFSVVLYYFGIASIFPMESKFFNFFSSKPYLVASIMLYILVNLILYNCHSFAVLLILRYFGGAISHGVIGIMFTLVFRQFHAQRSRVLGYATMYSVLFGTGPLAYILNAWLFSHFSFNSIFLFKIFSEIPGFLMMCIILRNDLDLRRNGKLPIRSIDWVSFIIYGSSLIMFAYFLLYGQYYGWFNSPRITFCFIGLLILLTLFVVRQKLLKVPYISMKIYKTRNFRIGMILLVFFYFGKGDLSMLASFITQSVNLDVFHYGYIMILNALGLTFGAVIAARYVLAGTRIRIIWMLGFGSLLAYHLICISILNSQAELSDLILPIFLHGVGNGSLIVSIVIFYVTAVPPEVGPSAAVTGVVFRSCTFTASMAVTSLLGLRFEKMHYQRFSQGITQASSRALERINAYQQTLTGSGMTTENAHAGAMKLLGNAVAKQDSLLSIRDYYIWLSFVLALLLVCIAAIPHFQYHIRKIRAKLIPI